MKPKEQLQVFTAALQAVLNMQGATAPQILAAVSEHKQSIARLRFEIDQLATTNQALRDDLAIAAIDLAHEQRKREAALAELETTQKHLRDANEDRRTFRSDAERERDELNKEANEVLAQMSALFGAEIRTWGSLVEQVTSARAERDALSKDVDKIVSQISILLGADIRQFSELAHRFDDLKISRDFWHGEAQRAESERDDANRRATEAEGKLEAAIAERDATLAENQKIRADFARSEDEWRIALEGKELYALQVEQERNGWKRKAEKAEEDATCAEAEREVWKDYADKYHRLNGQITSYIWTQDRPLFLRLTEAIESTGSPPPIRATPAPEGSPAND